MTARRIPVAIVILSLALLLSCSDDKTVNTPEPEYSRGTPEDLLAAFSYSLEQRDIDIYAECLDEGYVFQFTDWDAYVVGLPEAEPWWGRTEDIACMANIFDCEDIIVIQCDLPIKSGPWATDDGLGYRLDPSIKFTYEEPGAVEPMTYWVYRSWLDVEVIPDPYDSEKWVFRGIVEVMKEGSTGGPAHPLEAATEASTFGGVKAMFR